jgi:hypothetical protein
MPRVLHFDVALLPKASGVKGSSSANVRGLGNNCRKAVVGSSAALSLVWNGIESRRLW